MLEPLDTIIGMLRGARPTVLNSCPICGRPVTSGDDRWRLRGATYGHRDCCTYRVREAARRGAYRARRPDTARGTD
jgi:hypothetical protein